MTDSERADAVEAATGWRPPVIYDVPTDQYRLATQEDVDRLSRGVQILGTFKTDLVKLLDHASSRLRDAVR